MLLYSDGCNRKNTVGCRPSNNGSNHSVRSTLILFFTDEMIVIKTSLLSADANGAQYPGEPYCIC